MNIDQSLRKQRRMKKSRQQEDEEQSSGDGVTLDLDRLGREKTRVEIGAATRVRRREPTKRPGKLDKPREIAPSSRRGKITKYALRICKHMNCSQSDREREGEERRSEDVHTKKKQEEEWMRAGISCGWTVTTAETMASIRDRKAIAKELEKRRDEGGEVSDLLCFAPKKMEIN